MENSISILDRAKRAEGPLEREREREREREGQRPVVRGGQWGSSLEEVSFSPFFVTPLKGASDSRLENSPKQKSRIYGFLYDFSYFLSPPHALFALRPSILCNL